MIDRSKDSVSMTDFLLAEAQIEKEKREAEQERNYFKFMCNGMMLSASVVSAIFANMNASLAVWQSVLLAVFVYAFLWLIRGIVHGFFYNDARSDSPSPLLYLVFILLPILFLLVRDKFNVDQ